MLSHYLLIFSILFRSKPSISLSIPLSLFLLLSHFCATYSHCKYKLQWFSFVFPYKVQQCHKFKSCHICLLHEYKIAFLHFLIFSILSKSRQRLSMLIVLDFPSKIKIKSFVTPKRILRNKYNICSKQSQKPLDSTNYQNSALNFTVF